LMISLPKMPYINRIYMVLANPTPFPYLMWGAVFYCPRSFFPF